MAEMGVGPMLKALPMAQVLRNNAQSLDLSPPAKVQAKGLDEARAAVSEQHAKIEQLKKNLVRALEWEQDVDEELASLKTADERRLLKR
jgi:hypothetical protein